MEVVEEHTEQIDEVQLQQPMNPILQQVQQNNNGNDIIINNDNGNLHQQRMNPSRCHVKIPNKETLLDFWINKSGLYAPPQRDLTAQFTRDVLSGSNILPNLFF